MNPDTGFYNDFKTAVISRFKESKETIIKELQKKIKVSAKL